jgi:hypothetical protein
LENGMVTYQRLSWWGGSEGWIVLCLPSWMLFSSFCRDWIFSWYIL